MGMSPTELVVFGMLAVTLYAYSRILRVKKDGPVKYT